MSQGSVCVSWSVLMTRTPHSGRTHKEPPSSVSGLRALVLVGQLGLVTAVSVVGGVFAGVAADAHFGGHGLFIIFGVFAGTAGGLYAAYRMLRKEIQWKR